MANEDTETMEALLAKDGPGMTNTITIGHCRDCRWWSGGGCEDTEPKGFGHCCSKAWERCDQYNPPDEVLVLGDPHKYNLTRPNFGCVAFERDG